MLNTVLKKIDVVPSIVVLENDQISLYSGENAFEWFNLHTAKPEVRDLRSTTPNPEEQPSSTVARNPVHQSKVGLVKLKVQEDGSKKTILEKAAELSQARDIDEETRFNRASLSSGHQKK
jgi:hypothetical protein